MKFLSFLLCCTFLLASCSKENGIPTFEVGEDFTDSKVRVISIDTFTVEVSTYKMDSIVTSSSNRIMIGQYTDEIFGITKAGSYMELIPSNYSIPDDAELDSIALILNYDGYFYSDTLRVSSIEVHLLKDEVRPEEEVFYNTSIIPHEEIPIATAYYKPEPLREDSLHISIPKTVGQTIFNKIQGGDINNENEFRNEMKGLAIFPGELDNSSIIGFTPESTQTYLRFFYSIPGEFEDNEQKFDLIINNEASYPTYFNAITSNTEATFLETLTDQEIDLSSNDANNRSYIQAGVGVITKIEFPSIKKIKEIPGTGTIINAVLRIKPPPQVFNDLLTIRDSLLVSHIDQNNNIGTQLINALDENVYATINESDKEFNEIIYEIPIGVYLEKEVAEVPEIDNAIAIFPKNFNNTVDRIVLEGENSIDYKAQLIITYAIYDENE